MSWKDRLKTRQEKQANNGVKPFTLPMDKTILRILPNSKDVEENFWHDFGQHWVKDEEGKPISVPLCNYHTYGTDCPYCKVVRETSDYIGQNTHLFDDAVVKKISDAKANGKILVNAAVRAKDGSYEIKLISLAKSAFNAFVSMLDDYGDAIVSPKEGLDVAIERTGKGLNTKYTVMPMPPGKKGGDIADDWTTKAVDLESWVKSQEVDSVKGKIAIERVAQIAGLSPPSGKLVGGSSAAAIERPALAIIGTDEETDILEAELEDVDVTNVNEKVVQDVPDDTPAELSADAGKDAGAEDGDFDMMSELDELDNL
jgi:hypothetical protein